MKKTMSKTKLFAVLSGIFVACLLVSNILASKTFTFAGVILPTAVIIFPLVYLVNDILAEIYGFEKTRNVILLGFVLNLFAVIVYNIAIALPAPIFASESAEAFAIVLSSSTRILLASFVAYLVGSIVNAKIMAIMRERSRDKLFVRCIGSTLVGEGLDAVLFITIAFIGTMSGADLITMIIAQTAFKVGFELVLYPVTRYIIKQIRRLPDYTQEDITS